jgi:alanine-synthesizing transaminase
VTVDDVYLGNGASELIALSMNALLERRRRDADPVARLPAVDRRRSACRRQAGALRVRRGSEWMPDIADIRRKITPRTKGIVVINPNNPTGALYPDACCSRSSRSRASTS